MSRPELDRGRVPGATRRCRYLLLDDAAVVAAVAAAGTATGVWLRHGHRRGQRGRQGRDHRMHHADHWWPIRSHGGPQRHRGKSQEDHLQEAEGRQGAHLFTAS